MCQLSCIICHNQLVSDLYTRRKGVYNGCILKKMREKEMEYTENRGKGRRDLYPRKREEMRMALN